VLAIAVVACFGCGTVGMANSTSFILVSFVPIWDPATEDDATDYPALSSCPSIFPILLIYVLCALSPVASLKSLLHVRHWWNFVLI